MQPFALALMQLALPADGDNTARMRHKLERLLLTYPWVQMAIFSELSAFGPDPANAIALPGAPERFFQELAREHSIWILPGTLFERIGERVYNTAPVINPAGEVVGRYRKMFPFLPYEVGVQGGEEFLVFDVPGVGRFGVSVCYDMWFPETTRTLVSLGAEVILHPTMTTTIDRDVELSIARASAAMFQTFFVDVNGAGELGVGRSILVGPYGDVLHEAGHSEEVIPIEIDIDRVRRSREFGLRGLGQPLKSFRDRRVAFDLYSKAGGELSYLQGLGPLARPERGTRVGIPLEHQHGEPRESAS
jgi:predicted amidohydrolase